MPKYLIHMGICGFGNQMLGFKEACIIAKHTNRIIVEPIFIPHGTIRNECKDYYKFSDIFDMDCFYSVMKCVNVQQISHIKINNVYNIRGKNEKNLTDSYYNLQKDYYNLSNVTFNKINKQYIKSYDDFDELKNIDDDVLVLLGTFNNIILSNCYKNGCLNEKCTLNKCFIEDYNNIVQCINFNTNIETIANNNLKFINTDINNLCVFHMRVLDLCKNKSFEYSYNNYNEKAVYNSICSYLKQIGKESLIENIFLIAPPQYETINNLQIFNTDLVRRIDDNKFTHDKFILSLVELFISEKAKILITSPTNTPNVVKQHTRSSFTLQTKNMRDLSKKYIHDINISNIYNTVMNKTLFIYRITGRGLLSEINILIVAIYYCNKNNFDLKIELDERSGLDGRLYFQYGFEKYFNLNSKYNKNNNYTKTIICGGFGKSHDDPTRLEFLKVRRTHIDFHTAVKFRKLLTLTPYILDLIKKQIVNLKLPESYVFMHIRRGDKLKREAKFIGFDKFITKHIQVNKSIKNIFIASDDYNTIIESNKYLTDNKLDYKIYHNINTNNKGHNTHYRLINKQYFTENEFVNFMLELEIARLSNHVYCTYTSNVGRYIALLLEDLTKITSLDKETWFSG